MIQFVINKLTYFDEKNIEAVFYEYTNMTAAYHFVSPNLSLYIYIHG